MCSGAGVIPLCQVHLGKGRRAPSHWLYWLVRVLPLTCVQYPSGLPHLKQLAQLLWLVLMVLLPPMYQLAHCPPSIVNPAAIDQ